MVLYRASHRSCKMNTLIFLITQNTDKTLVDCFKQNGYRYDTDPTNFQLSPSIFAKITSVIDRIELDIDKMIKERKNPTDRVMWQQETHCPCVNSASKAYLKFNEQIIDSKRFCCTSC